MLTILLEYIANNCHKRKEVLKYKNDKLDKKAAKVAKVAVTCLLNGLYLYIWCHIRLK